MSECSCPHPLDCERMRGKDNEGCRLQNVLEAVQTNICVETAGKCADPDNCRCKKDAEARPGW